MRTSNIERRTLNAEHRTSNAERPTGEEEEEIFGLWFLDFGCEDELRAERRAYSAIFIQKSKIAFGSAGFLQVC